LFVDLSGPDTLLSDSDVETPKYRIVAHLVELLQAADMPPLVVLYTQEGSVQHALSDLIHE
jgi:hypothetical protein